MHYRRSSETWVALFPETLISVRNKAAVAIKNFVAFLSPSVTIVPTSATSKE